MTLSALRIDWLKMSNLRQHALPGVVITVLGAVVLAYALLRSSGSEAYLTAEVELGDIVSVVSATGTVTPVGEVRVGSQLSGQIAELLVDFNSAVSEGQALARLDPQSYEAIVEERQAALDIAEANVLLHEAALGKAESELATARASKDVGVAETDSMRAQRLEAERELARMEALAEEAAISGSEVDRAQARADTAAALLRAAETQEIVGDAATDGAEAAVRMALAQLEHAVAEVRRAQAALQQAAVHLERTTIRSPIDGVVIGRTVDRGQTVAATLEAPTLFTLAKDLRQMEVHAQIDQADIGKIQRHQQALFAVDAYPDHPFTGTVTQIRKAPLVIRNVVTYTVIVSAENKQLLLLPGMTAVLRIAVTEQHDVLKVPNAALRYRPSDSVAAPVEAAAARGELQMPDQGTPGLVWVDDDGRLTARIVGVGAGDETVSAILAGELEAGEHVVIGNTAQPDASIGLRLGF